MPIPQKIESQTIEIDYTPFLQQRWFHKSKKRIRVAVTGARAGKTLCAAHDVLDKCILQPGYRGKDIIRKMPYTIVVAAPTYKTLEKVTLPTMFRIIPHQLFLEKYHQTQRKLLLRGLKGTTCIYFTNASDPTSWQGQELYGVWVDEFALIKERMFDEAETRVSTHNGWIILTGTLSRGPGWAQKRIKEYSETEEGQEELELFQWRTLDNPYANKKHIMNMKNVLPDKYFRRMFEACWDTFEGQIYDDMERKTHCIDPREYTIIYPNWRKRGQGKTTLKIVQVVAGVDWGHANPGVIVVCGKTQDGTWYVLDEVYEHGLLVAHENPTQDTWLRRARQLKADWDVSTFWCDPSEPGHIALFNKAGVHARAANHEVSEGIMTVAQLLHVDRMTKQPRLFFFDNLNRTIEEMMHYQWKEEAVAGTYKETPLKENDHSCDALRYCLHSEIKRGTFVSEPFYEP